MFHSSARRFQIVLVTILACIVSSASACVLEAWAKAPSSAEGSKQKHYRRADMLIAGSSCAVCLMGVERKLKDVPGVKKAAVSIYHPYPAIVIYDSDKTNLTEIINSLKGEPVVVTKVEDAELDKVPAVIVPKAPEGAAL